MSNANACAQCERPIDGPDQKFCPSCGQPTPAHRIDWEFLSHELQHSVFHVDKGILFTVKHLLTRPGHMIREYLQGKRGGHFKPALTIMILGALVTLLSKYVLGVGAFDDMVKFNVGSPKGLQQASKVVDAQGMMAAFKHVSDWMSAHFAIVTLMLLPFEALSFKWAFRRFRNLNYPEWLVIAAFVTAQTFVIYAIGILVRHWVPDAGPYFQLAGIFAMILTLVQFFQGETRWKIVLRSLLGFLIFSFFNAVFIAIGGGYLLSQYLR